MRPVASWTNARAQPPDAPGQSVEPLTEGHEFGVLNAFCLWRHRRQSQRGCSEERLAARDVGHFLVAPAILTGQRDDLRRKSTVNAAAHAEGDRLPRPRGEHTLLPKGAYLGG